MEGAAFPLRVIVRRGARCREIVDEIGEEACGDSQEVVREYSLQRWDKGILEGWFCGDAHNHVARSEKVEDFRTMWDAAEVAAAEGLDFVGLGSPWTRTHHVKYRDSIGRPLEAITEDERVKGKSVPEICEEISQKGIVLAIPGNEFIKTRFAHLFLFGGNIDEDYWRYYDDVFDFWQCSRSRRVREQEPEYRLRPIYEILTDERYCWGARVYAHPTSWWYEPEAGFVTNIAATLPFDTLVGPLYDAIVVMGYEPERREYQELWYELLNRGYRITAVSELDACFDNRRSFCNRPLVLTYCHIGDDVIGAKTIAEAVKKGKTFVSSGPLLDIREEGKTVIGAVLPSDGQERKWSLFGDYQMRSSDGISRVQLIRNGKILREWRPCGSFEESITICEREDSWYVMKVYGKEEKRELALSSAVYFRRDLKHPFSGPVMTPFEIRGGRNQVLGCRVHDFATGKEKTYWGKERVEFEATAACTIEVFDREAGKKIREVRPFFDHKPIWDHARHLYLGRFIRKELACGEVPVEAFRIGELRDILLRKMIFHVS
ncbi:MAG: hypothetical protein D6679_08075 [Candidatus Hydrogenedentota bacterium]|nr:MAG: hypothetical protein D6679_08075 [Candidatus Hydrogenedentota bacterium]